MIVLVQCEKVLFPLSDGSGTICIEFEGLTATDWSGKDTVATTTCALLHSKNRVNK